MHKEIIHALKQCRACDEGVDYVRSHRKAAEAWKLCTEPSWLLYSAGKRVLDNTVILRAKLDCVDLIRYAITHSESIRALEAAKSYCECEISLTELKKYRADADDVVTTTYSRLVTETLSNELIETHDAACAASSCTEVRPSEGSIADTVLNVWCIDMADMHHSQKIKTTRYINAKLDLCERIRKRIPYELLRLPTYV